MVPLIKSSVRVEEEVSTRPESVDMEADKTKTITIAISSGERSCSIVGIIES
jgi:hypothetical protein